MGFGHPSGKLGTVSPDPPATRLTYVGNVLAKRGHAQASHVLQDLATADPADADLLPMAARSWPERRATWRAHKGPGIDDPGPDTRQRPCALPARPFHRRRSGQLAYLARLQDLVGDCHLTRDLASRIGRATADFTKTGALWRRWVTVLQPFMKARRFPPRRCPS